MLKRRRATDDAAVEKARIQKIYDNPPCFTTLTTAERLENAVTFFGYGWNKKDCYTKAGINSRTLDDAIKRKNSGGSIHASIGPPIKITPELAAEVNILVTERSKKLDAVLNLTQKQGISDVVNEIRRMNQSNTRAVPHNLSKSSLQKLERMAQIDVNIGTLKNQTRESAFDNIRTALSAAAAIDFVSRTCSAHPYMMFSSDDVSILLNAWDSSQKPKVLSTKEAKTFLQAHETGVATRLPVQGQRMLTFHITIWYRGAICTIRKFCDKQFKFRRGYKVIVLSDGQYCILYNFGLDEVLLNIVAYQLCVIPCIEKHRQMLIDLEMGSPSDNILELCDSWLQMKHIADLLAKVGVANDETTNVMEMSPVSNQDPKDQMEMSDEIHEEEKIEEVDQSQQRLKVSEKYKVAVSACDGDYEGIKALYTHIFKYVQDRLPILFLKWPGGASMTNSPNDVGKMHTILHSLYKNPKYLYIDDFIEPIGKGWKTLKEFLIKYLPKRSAQSIWKAMCHSDSIIDQATRRHVVEKIIKKSKLKEIELQSQLLQCLCLEMKLKKQERQLKKLEERIQRVVIVRVVNLEYL